MDLNKIIADYSKLSRDDYYPALEAKINQVLPKIGSYTLNLDGTKVSGENLLVHVMIATLWSDHEFSANEAGFLQSVVSQLIYKDVTPNDIVGMIVNAGNNLAGCHNFADFVVDGLGQADKELKENLVAMCVLVALLDGKVTDKEKEFLARLLA